MIELKENKIVFMCEKCGITLRIEADTAPERGRCPRCGARIPIPSKEEARRGHMNKPG